MTSWQGTDYIERRLNLVMNRLSYVIVPDRSGALDADKALAYVEEAVKTRDWLAAQKAPRGVKRWAEYELSKLDRAIDRALQKLKVMLP